MCTYWQKTILIIRSQPENQLKDGLCNVVPGPLGQLHTPVNGEAGDVLCGEHLPGAQLTVHLNKNNNHQSMYSVVSTCLVLNSQYT